MSPVFPLSGSLLRRQAQQQGGLLDGQDPTDFLPSDPLRLWIIELGVIIAISQLLSLLLRRLRQPKVIAEVIGGVLLGPTAFGDIPYFTHHIFPIAFRPYLTLTADIGLVLFLFLIGLELDISIIKKNAKKSITIAFAGMILPFGLGAALSIPIYHHFIGDSVKFTNFMLFTGVAYTITAFPVLCRILTELRLLDNPLGVIVLSAGVGNDIVGWILLALSVALVNASSPLTTVWILLAAVAWILFLLFPVKRLWLWLARRTGSIENGPTQIFMTCTVLMMFTSAFYTDVIGVNAIFGGFLAGLVVPREGGLAIALMEKLEDMTTIIFLPLYFTLSGLNTNLRLLNDGITWGFTIAIICVSYCGKFGGCTSAARFLGYSWQESATIGSLMSCKGLVELIVLNVGLSAGILNQRVFSMFVLEAVVLTFMTTPAVTMLYPPARKNAPGSRKAGAIHTHTGEPSTSREGDDAAWKTRLTVVLDKIEHLPGLMALTHLLQPSVIESVDMGLFSTASTSLSDEKSDIAMGPALEYQQTRRPNVGLSVDAFRLMELSDRTSAVMKSSVTDTLLHTDPLLNVFKTFAELNGIHVSTSLSVVAWDNQAATVAEHARESASDLVLIPWLPASVPVLDDAHKRTVPNTPLVTTTTSPFDNFFKNHMTETNASIVHAQLIRGTFSKCTTDVALFIDRAHGTAGKPAYGLARHVILPFFGGPDERLALDLVVQLCGNPKTTATVFRMIKTDGEASADEISPPQNALLRDEKDPLTARPREVGYGESTTFPDTVYGHATTTTRLQSETADNLSWAKYALPASNGTPRGSRVADALSRITFAEIKSTRPLHAVLAKTFTQLEAAHHNTDTYVITGRSRTLVVEDHKQELKDLMSDHGSLSAEVVKAIGDVGSAFVVSGSKIGLVVVQSAQSQ